MTISRDDILEEIRRTAVANGGRPLGRASFFSQTGIRESDWSGRFWARWNDALKDAGFAPNSMKTRRDDAEVLERFAELARELGKLPVSSELRLKRRVDRTFPSEKTFERFGRKQQFLTHLFKYCSESSRYSSLLPLILAGRTEENLDDTKQGLSSDTIEGFVYLVKMGKHFKIGKTFSVPRRHRELGLELPEKLKPIHSIRTDDPTGIEVYWHRRFAAKCTNGEWFALSPKDVSAFKKRKFM